MCHEVASDWFATNAPDPPHWTLNSCFGAFRTIWVHSGPFGCLKKLSGKRAELGQRFVPRSRFAMFRNERTRPTLSDPKIMFWVHLGSFGCLTELGVKRVELLPKFVPRSRIVISRNARTRSTPLDPKLMFWCVSYYSGAFGIVWLP